MTRDRAKSERKAQQDRLLLILRAFEAENPPRCPRCGSYAWVYKGDRQVCADCGR